jgi:pimeloyl-ACP methyl ester carboxylesterase
MRPEADLSLRGQVRLLAEFLERLELEEVTLVFNDWCGAQLLVAEGWDGRVERLVLASCETYDNYPPGLPGRVAALAARLPGGLAASFPDSRFVEIADSRTLIPVDQPGALADAIAAFVLGDTHEEPAP